MVNQVVLVLGIFIALMIYILTYIRMYNNKRLEMIDWFLLSLTTINYIAFVFVLWGTNKGYNTYFWTTYISAYDNYTVVIYLLSALILGLSSFTGWKITSIVTRDVKFKNENLTIKNVIDIKRYINKLKVIAWFMFLLAVISYGLYTRAYGGFLGLFQYSIAIRSGTMKINNPFSFLQKFGSLAYISSFIFYGILIDKSITRDLKKHSVLGFIVSFIFSIYVLISLAGRVSMLIYLATFILALILSKHKNILKLVINLILFVIVSIFMLFSINILLKRTGVNIGLIELFTRELSFPFATFIVQFSQPKYRLFKDIVVAPLFLLPQRIWSELLNIEVASSYNTYMFYGARKGEAGVSGSVPVDLLTFSNMQASIFGVLIVGLLWGGLLYYLESLCKKFPTLGIRQTIYAYTTLNVAILTVLYGDPQHIIIRNFALIVSIILIRLRMKYRIKVK